VLAGQRCNEFGRGSEMRSLPCNGLGGTVPGTVGAVWERHISIDGQRTPAGIFLRRLAFQWAE